jgi:predicted DNA-binding transcriptional regulator AlpA
MSDLDLMLMPEVAEDTRLSLDTLRYLRHTGTGPPSFKLGRRVVYRREAVQAWVSQREAEGTSKA